MPIWFQVRIMRKRLVRKTFDMIQELSESENKEVCGSYSYYVFSFSIPAENCYWLRKLLNLIPSGLQEIMGELWQVSKAGLYRGHRKSQAHNTSVAVLHFKKWRRTDEFRWLCWKHAWEPECYLLLGNRQSEKCKKCSILGKVGSERYWGMYHANFGEDLVAEQC